MITAIHVEGVPAPQGSKKGYIVNGKVNMVEASAGVKPWRLAVVEAAAAQCKGWRAGTRPVSVIAVFKFQKARTSKLKFPGRNQGDLDKLMRSTFDGLVMSGIIDDDSQIVGGAQKKRWCYEGEAPGADLIIQTREDCC